MVRSATAKASGQGKPVRIRHGPAAVRGDASPPKRHWPAGREGGGGGSPESEDLRSPRIRSPRGRRKRAPPIPCTRRSRSSSCSCSPGAAARTETPALRRTTAASPGSPARPRRASPATTTLSRPSTTEAPEPAFPVTIEARERPGRDRASGRTASSRSPRPPPSRSSRSAPATQVIAVDDQSNYPAEAPMTDLPGSRPTSRRSRPTSPISSLPASIPAGSSTGSSRSASPCSSSSAATDLADAYEQIEELGAATGHPEEAETLVAGMEVEIDELAARDRRRRRGPRPSTTSSAPTSSRRRRRRSSAASIELLGLENIADEAERRGARLPAAVRGVHRLGRPRPDRPVGHEVLWPDRRDGREAARLGSDHRGAGRPHRPGRRRHRLPLGPADCRLRRGRRRGGLRGRADERARRGELRLVARRTDAARPRSGRALRPLDRGRGRVPGRRRSCSGSRSGRWASAPARVAREVLSHVPVPRHRIAVHGTEDAILWELRAPRVAARRCSSARCSRRPAPPTRASSATHSPIRTCSARPPAPGLGATLVIAYELERGGGGDLRPVAAFVGRRDRRRRCVPARAARSAGRSTGDAHPRGRHRRRVPHRRPDLRPAAPLRHGAGGLRLDPGPARDLRLERRR